MTTATIAAIPKTQLQPPVGPSVDSPCHPCITTFHLSYRFPIFETSATALCGTTGITHIRINTYIYIYIEKFFASLLYIYIYYYIYTSIQFFSFKPLAASYSQSTAMNCSSKWLLGAMPPKMPKTCFFRTLCMGMMILGACVDEACFRGISFQNVAHDCRSS